MNVVRYAMHGSVMNRGEVLEKEVWERLSPTKQKGRLHQIVRIKWAFACKNLKHWSFRFHCSRLTSSANLCVTSMSVGSQPCFNVAKRCGNLVMNLSVTNESIMNTVFTNVVCYELIYYERNMLWMGRLSRSWFAASISNHLMIPHVIPTSNSLHHEACATQLCSHIFNVGLILEPREGWIVMSSMLTPR